MALNFQAIRKLVRQSLTQKKGRIRDMWEILGFPKILSHPIQLCVPVMTGTMPQPNRIRLWCHRWCFWQHGALAVGCMTISDAVVGLRCVHVPRTRDNPGQEMNWHQLIINCRSCRLRIQLPNLIPRVRGKKDANQQSQSETSIKAHMSTWKW